MKHYVLNLVKTHKLESFFILLIVYTTILNEIQKNTRKSIIERSHRQELQSVNQERRNVIINNVMNQYGDQMGTSILTARNLRIHDRQHNSDILIENPLVRYVREDYLKEREERLERGSTVTDFTEFSNLENYEKQNSTEMQDLQVQSNSLQTQIDEARLQSDFEKELSAKRSWKRVNDKIIARRSKLIKRSVVQENRTVVIPKNVQKEEILKPLNELAALQKSINEGEKELNKINTNAVNNLVSSINDNTDKKLQENIKPKAFWNLLGSYASSAARYLIDPTHPGRQDRRNSKQNSKRRHSMSDLQAEQERLKHSQSAPLNENNDLAYGNDNESNNNNNRGRRISAELDISFVQFDQAQQIQQDEENLRQNLNYLGNAASMTNLPETRELQKAAEAEHNRMYTGNNSNVSAEIKHYDKHVQPLNEQVQQKEKVLNDLKNFAKKNDNN